MSSKIVDSAYKPVSRVSTTLSFNYKGQSWHYTSDDIKNYQETLNQLPEKQVNNELTAYWQNALQTSIQLQTASELSHISSLENQLAKNLSAINSIVKKYSLDKQLGTQRAYPNRYYYAGALTLASLGLLYLYKDTVLKKLDESVQDMAKFIVNKAIAKKVAELKTVISPTELFRNIMPLLDKSSRQLFSTTQNLLESGDLSSLD